MAINENYLGTNNSLQLDADVIVVGGGPAGVLTAKTLHENRINVLLLDKYSFPRFKACAGGLMQHSFVEFPFIEDFIDSYIYSVKVHSSDLLNSFLVTSKDQDHPLMAMTKNRTDFDNKMLGLLQKIGCRVITNENVINIEKDNAFIIVTTESGKKFKSLVVVGADSAVSTVAKICKIGLYSPHQMINRKTELGIAIEKSLLFNNSGINSIKYPPVVDEKSGLYEPYTVQLYLHFNGIKGYAWNFPRSSGTNIGIGGLGYQGKELKNAFKEFEKLVIQKGYIPDNLSKNSLISQDNNSKDDKSIDYVGAVLPATVPYKLLVADNVLLVGDAGGFCSAATGEGIYYGMKSGKVAGEFLVKMIRKYRSLLIPIKKHDHQLEVSNYFSKDKLVAYQKRVHKTIGRELKFQYLVKNYVLMNERRCRKAVRWGFHDKKLSEIFTKFLTGEQGYKDLWFKMVYHYIRCKILDKFNKLGEKTEEVLRKNEK